MMPAAKHGDPQLGIDIHLCVVPPSPSPVPLPTPHTSIVFDPFDYVPIFGATVTVCGMKRATAGTSATAIHIPPGFPFAPKIPDTDDEIFMGSSTVVADGDPFSYIALPVLSCQVAGMISPPRLKKKGPPSLMILPTTVNLAIPTTVVVGGAPTISLMGMAFKGLFAALGKFAKSGLFKRMRQALFKNMNPGFLKCTILRAEPVNILTGAVAVDQEDFTLPGRIPLEWIRSYSSSATRKGLCGVGWETIGDIRLEVDAENGGVSMIHPSKGPFIFERLPVAPGDVGAELELMDGALLSDHDQELQVHTKEDRIYHFPKTLAHKNEEGRTEYPIIRISDLCGNTIDFERRRGTLMSILDSAGRRLNIQSELGRMTEVSMNIPEQETPHVFIRYEYDISGDLVSVIDALGHPYTFAYDDHLMTRHTDRNGLSFYYEYQISKDGERRVNHAWGDGGLYNYQFAYIDVLSERRITDSLGHVSIVKLNEAGLPISEIDPLGGITSFEYDDRGQTTAVIDQAQHKTNYEYDDRGNLLTLTRSDGKCVKTEWNRLNKAIKITDLNGAVWGQEWDDRGLLIRQKSPLGAESLYAYDGQGQMVRFTNPKGAQTTLAFDGGGNLRYLTDALGRATHFSHDVFGNVVEKTDALNQRTSYRYDAKSRLTHVILPSRATISCVYDHQSNLINHVDENGAETRLQYFGLGEIAKRIQPDGHVVQYHYDTEERLIGVMNQRGEIYHLRRDALGRIVEEVDYWGQSRRYAYNASGYLMSSTDPLGRTIKYAMDPLGRILKKTLPDGVFESFTYDANDNLVEAKNEHGTIKREFDPGGRLLKEAQGAFTITNVYDANGNRIARKSSLGNTVAYEFDSLDQTVSIRINQDEPIRIERDARGRVTHEELSPHISRRLGYSADGYLTEQAVALNESLLFEASFQYDKAGNLTQRGDSQYGTDVYRYDPLGRIAEHLDPESRVTRYLNDPAGDRLRTQIVERMRRRVVGEEMVESEWSRVGGYEGTYYRFDRAGNLVERRDDQRDLHLVWDANQRLIESHTNGTVTRYGYDPLGRRLFKETGDNRTLFYWDGDALVGETVVSIKPPAEPKSETEGYYVVDLAQHRKKEQGPAPQKLREYVYYPGTFEPLALMNGMGDVQQVYHYHNDPNGCPTRLTDVSGEVKWGASYTAWGAIARLHVNEMDNPIRLQGQYEDGETLFTYNRFRYYDSNIGSFITPDPLGLKAGMQIYQYAANIFGWIDPLGLNCEAARKAASEVSDEFKKLHMCKQFADELEEKLRAQGIHGTRLDMRTGTGRIYSDTHGLIGETGEHMAIRVEDTVFDNLNPGGISHADWIKDFGGPQFTSPPHARITEIPF